MPTPRLPVTALCLVAFGVATAVSVGITTSAARSGRPGLTQAARDLTRALRSEPVDVAGLARLIAPDDDLRDPRVREAVRAVASSMAGDAIVLSSTPGAGGTGTTQIAVSRQGPIGARADVLTLSWLRDPQGGWRWDVVAR